MIPGREMIPQIGPQMIPGPEVILIKCTAKRRNVLDSMSVHGYMRKTQIPQAFITTIKTGKRTVLKDKINLAIFNFWTKLKAIDFNVSVSEIITPLI